MKQEILCGWCRSYSGREIVPTPGADITQRSCYFFIWEMFSHMSRPHFSLGVAVSSNEFSESTKQRKKRQGQKEIHDRHCAVSAQSFFVLAFFALFCLDYVLTRPVFHVKNVRSPKKWSATVNNVSKLDWHARSPIASESTAKCLEILGPPQCAKRTQQLFRIRPLASLQCHYHWPEMFHVLPSLYGAC